MPGMATRQLPIRPLLDTATVARMFNVDPKTVTRWERTGRIVAATRTLGGHRRYYQDEVEELFKMNRAPAIAERCPDCTYLLSSPSHKAACR